MKALSCNSNNMGLGVLVLLLFSLKTALGGTIVTSLPGYSGTGDPLPFKLETGYVGVGENEEVQLFYYFVQSQNNPEQDPLMFFIPEGPGCSSLAPFFRGKGPLVLDIKDYNEGLPKLLVNPSPWTQDLNIIFLDAPAGVGFSYSKTEEGYTTAGDYYFAKQSYEFLLKWLQDHTEFSKNQLYVAGEGYAGTIIPLIIDKILNGNEDINIKGYVLGNPGTDHIIDFNAQTTFAFRLGLIPELLYEEAYKSCDNGNFTMENPSASCTAYNDEIAKIISAINWPNILQPTCATQSRDFLNLQTDDDSSTRRYLKEKSIDFLNLQADTPNKLCESFVQTVFQTWANDQEVQAALHVLEGTKTSWSYCNNSDDYNKNVSTVVDYHRKFTTTNLQALIYSGDHDMAISHIGTQKWIWKLDLPVVENWTSWSVDNEVAGFTRRFTKDNRYNLTFATVKGAGHFAVQDNPRECFKMLQSWMVNGTLSLNLS